MVTIHGNHPSGPDCIGMFFGHPGLRIRSHVSLWPAKSVDAPRPAPHPSGPALRDRLRASMRSGSLCTPLTFRSSCRRWAFDSLRSPFRRLRRRLRFASAHTSKRHRSRYLHKSCRVFETSASLYLGTGGWLVLPDKDFPTPPCIRSLYKKSSS
jgi:hypothetical protein